jgi:hypothetical protein
LSASARRGATASCSTADSKYRKIAQHQSLGFTLSPTCVRTSSYPIASFPLVSEMGYRLIRLGVIMR